MIQHSGADHRHDLAGVECRGLLLDLREIACLQFPGRAEQRLIGFAQKVTVHLPPAGVVALGKMTQGIGRREGKRHAGGGATDFARRLAGHLAEQATEQLAPELFEILRCQADAGGGDEFLDMPLVERDPMRLSDAIHHLDLQRNDRHRRPGLRQQFERAVEQGIVENRLIEFPIVVAGVRSAESQQADGQRRDGRPAQTIHIAVQRRFHPCATPGHQTSYQEEARTAPDQRSDA